MTREKAIEKITFLRDNACHFYLEKETENALDMAIEALRICGNFIRAERLREEMYHQAKEWSEKLGYKLDDYEAIIYTSPLPEDGQNVLICLRSVPLPKPWEEE